MRTKSSVRDGGRSPKNMIICAISLVDTCHAAASHFEKCKSRESNGTSVGRAAAFNFKFQLYRFRRKMILLASFLHRLTKRFPFLSHQAFTSTTTATPSHWHRKISNRGSEATRSRSVPYDLKIGFRKGEHCELLGCS